MNKNIIRCGLAALFMAISVNANAQFDLGSLLNKAKESVSKSKSSGDSSNSTGDLLSGLAGLLGIGNQASVNDLIGTWSYVEPAVEFSSGDILKSLGGQLASSTVENKIKDQLVKLGITEGKLKMTFDKDGNFTQTAVGKTLKGTYTLEDNNVVLKYGGKMKQVAGTTKVDGNNLLIMFDVSKLLDFAQTLGTLSNNSSLSTLGQLAGSMDGMQAGLKLQKE